MTTMKKILCLALLATVSFFTTEGFTSSNPSSVSFSRRNSFSACKTSSSACFVPRHHVAVEAHAGGGFESSSLVSSMASLDPVQLLSDALVGFIKSPAILLVPIGAAFGLASLVAFLIVSYSNPEVEDDDEVDTNDEF
jgi:hypothetical protein